jgi:DNA-binding CsgD family transcriptional regulator
MKNEYSIFFEFLKKYQPTGFQGIDRSDPLIAQMEEMLKMNKQFFYVGDLIQVKIIFTSSGSKDILGVEPDQFDPGTFYIRTHPDDLTRHNLARTKLFNLGQDMFITHKEQHIVSSNFQIMNASGNYSDLLIQCYLFYTGFPYQTVFIFQVCTDISHFKHINYGYHYYIGDDMSFFRYPDEKLIKTGNVFSKREFEIIKFMASGLNSRQIADKLFLSVHTVNTHRRNIIKKTNKDNTQELLMDLKERGVI